MSMRSRSLGMQLVYLVASLLSLSFISLEASAAALDTSTTAASLAITEGHIPWSLGHGPTYQTYFKLFGKITPACPRPLIVLHGGPGLTSDYLSPFSDLAAHYNTPVIIYDQLGNGRSTHLDSAPTSFWTIDLFVKELTQVINFFNIQDSFNLAGHSWGTVLGMEFTQRTQPRGLEHLILSDGLASIDLWNESEGELVAALPAWIGAGLAAGFSDPVAFQAALRAYYAVHGIRIVPPPADYNATLAWLFGPKGDPTVASAPILDGWTIIDRLPTIKPKTLVINGKFDIAQDFVIKPLVDDIPKAKWIKFQNSSHMPFWEERAGYMKAVSDFLKT